MRTFAEGERADALELLDAAIIHDGTPASPRLLRCVAFSSGGSMHKLKTQVGTLLYDFRDVIVEGEYVPEDGKLVRVRNFNEAIPDDA